MMERRDKIMEIAGQLFPEKFAESCRETERFCEEHAGEMAEGFLEALWNVTAQAEGGKEKEREAVCYLLFSFLHSSIFLREYWIRIDRMGEAFYGDPLPAEAYWNAGCLYRLLERDIGEIRREVAKRIPRIREYETDYIRYAYAPYYHRMAKEFILEMMEEVLGDGRMLSGMGGKRIKVMFGEYMGDADILYVCGKEEDG